MADSVMILPAVKNLLEIFNFLGNGIKAIFEKIVFFGLLTGVLPMVNVHRWAILTISKVACSF